jgi:Na+-transporting methylmalonyl-CoA/oxaloacetate decarboxylase gamma subunit
VSSAELEEALELTIAGVGTTFLILALLMLLILTMKWVSGIRFVQRRTGALAAAEAAGARRNRALAAAIAVSAALDEDDAASQLHPSQDTST